MAAPDHIIFGPFFQATFSWAPTLQMGQASNEGDAVNDPPLTRLRPDNLVRATRIPFRRSTRSTSRMFYRHNYAIQSFQPIALRLHPSLSLHSRALHVAHLRGNQPTLDRRRALQGVSSASAVQDVQKHGQCVCRAWIPRAVTFTSINAVARLRTPSSASRLSVRGAINTVTVALRSSRTYSTRQRSRRVASGAPIPTPVRAHTGGMNSNVDDGCSESSNRDRSAAAAVAIYWPHVGESRGFRRLESRQRSADPTRICLRQARSDDLAGAAVDGT